MGQVDRQQLAGAEVVAVGEAARDDQQPVVGQACGALDDAVDVDAIGAPARQLDGGGGVLVAVDAGGAQDECSYHLPPDKVTR